MSGILPSDYGAPLARSYRWSLAQGRFRFFRIREAQSDILLGVSPAAYTPELALAAATALSEARRRIQLWLDAYPRAGASYAPVPRPATPGAPWTTRPLLDMLDASDAAGVGPMAAVAGAIADWVLDAVLTGLAERGAEAEAMAENGGDCALLAREPLRVAMAAPGSPFGDLAGLELPPGRWGVATSSGRLGHSASLGKADACTAVASGAALADAWATAMANRVGGPADVEDAVAQVERDNGPLAAFACTGGRAAYRGTFPLLAGGSVVA